MVVELVRSRAAHRSCLIQVGTPCLDSSQSLAGMAIEPILMRSGKKNISHDVLRFTIISENAALTHFPS